MTTMSSAVLALLLYIGLTVWQGAGLAKGLSVRLPLLQGLGALAILLHAYAIFPLVHTPSGVQLGFFQVSSLIAWLINVVVMASSLRIRVESLFVFLFPLAALSILCSLTLSSHYVPPAHISVAIGWHILLSLLAYSLLTIATAQTVMMVIQDRQLRGRHFQGILRVLPPLETMDALLFKILWAGVILLTLSLLSGFLFFEDIEQQHLAHKMIFASVAWIVYSILLWGHHRHGWRGRTACYWALGGFLCLMLAYFGTKFVLELILA